MRDHIEVNQKKYLSDASFNGDQSHAIKRSSYAYMFSTKLFLQIGVI